MKYDHWLALKLIYKEVGDAPFVYADVSFVCPVQYLSELANEGALGRKKRRPAANIWWITKYGAEAAGLTYCPSLR